MYSLYILCQHFETTTKTLDVLKSLTSGKFKFLRKEFFKRLQKVRGNSLTEQSGWKRISRKHRVSVESKMLSLGLM